MQWEGERGRIERDFIPLFLLCRTVKQILFNFYSVYSLRCKDPVLAEMFVSKFKCTHEHQSTLLIKDVEVDTTIRLEKRLRDEEIIEKEKRGSESFGSCLMVRGPLGAPAETSISGTISAWGSWYCGRLSRRGPVCLAAVCLCCS